MAVRDSALLLAWVAIVLLAFGMSGLIRQMRIMANGMSVHRPGLGRAVGIRSAQGIQASVLLYIQEDCGACATIAPAATQIARRLREKGSPVELVAVLPGDVTQEWSGIESFEGRSDWFTESGVTMTPYYVVQSSGRVLDEGSVRSAQHLEAVIEQTLDAIANQQNGRPVHDDTKLHVGVAEANGGDEPWT